VIRPVTPAQTPALVALAESTGIFAAGEAASLLGDTLEALHHGRLEGEHVAIAWSEAPDGPPLGWAYFAAQSKAPGVWDLWWIGVAPTHQGRGIGEALLRHVEDHVRAHDGRLLLIETSALPALERTRRFYARRGYRDCGTIPDYYADGDGKVTFGKRL
jgi:ribosomal protein S18 acetylase RimI-like enzyme